MSISTVLLSPKSYGSVKLRSDDPFDAPLIDANFFGNNEDLNALSAGVMRCYELANSRSFSNIVKNWYCPSSMQNVEEKTAEFWNEYVTKRVQSASHQVFICLLLMFTFIGNILTLCNLDWYMQNGN